MSVTLVSCYYNVKSKHTHEKYTGWIKNLLENITSNIIIFTSKDLINELKNIGSKNENLLILEKELEELPLNNKYDLTFWNNQENMDVQKKCGRTKYCFQIWNSKLDFLKMAIELNPFNSDKFVWNDIGSMRDDDFKHRLSNYPKYENVSNDKLDIILLRDFSDKTQMFFHNEVHISGSMFGGGKEVILELHKLYYIYFDIYARSNRFIGCDQQILSTLYLKNQDKFNIIKPETDNIIDIWFYLYYQYIK